MGCTPSKSTGKPKAIVIGASGHVGKATVGALVSRHGSKIDTYAGVRDPSKFDKMDGVTPVKADMSDKAGLTEILKGYNRVFIVTPGHEDRTMLATNALDAAKDAGVDFVLLLSVLTADKTDSIFGKQFQPLEAKIKTIDVPYTVVRLPLFIDNNWLNADSIKGEGTFYDPRDPSKMHTPVAVQDVGKAAADVLASPKNHEGNTYKLVCPAYCLNGIAAAFTKACEKQVTVTTVHYNQCKESFAKLGFPEWQANAIIELYKYIDDGSKITNEQDTGDIEKITGEKATTMEEWVNQNAAGFK